jgi:hypothetical protein
MPVSVVERSSRGAHTRAVKKAVHAECENRGASAATPVVGGAGGLVLIFVAWSTLHRAFGIVGVGVAIGVALVAMLIGIVYHFAVGPGMVVAGDDGVELRWGRKRQFLRYYDINRLKTDGATFRIVPLGRLAIPVRLRGLGPRGDARETAVVERIARKIEDPTRTAPLAAAEPFQRGGRDAEAWLAAIAEHLPSEGGYRSAPIDRGTLLRVLKSGRSAPTARAACAWLLRESGFEEGEEDIVREAATATASVDLEETLTAIATPSTSPEAIAAHMARVPALP